MRMTKTKTMLVNKDARNSETTHLLQASGHFDPTALSQLAQMSKCPNAHPDARLAHPDT